MVPYHGNTMAYNLHNSPYAPGMVLRGPLMRCALRMRGARVKATGHLPPHKYRRNFTSSSAPPPPPPAGASSSDLSAGMLAPFMQELDQLCPSFRVKGRQITILRTPREFYETLTSKILGAKRRIFLATLYIGKTETELIATIRQALIQNPELHVSILADCLRGTREAPEASSASLLAPLVSEFGADRVDVRLYHTANLRGLRKALIPQRINEGWGLQHMKLYGIDNELLLSGANLSADYFTNRQDRYHLFADARITEYFASIHAAVAALSFRLLPADAHHTAESNVKDTRENDGSPTTVPGFTLTWPETNAVPLPLSDTRTNHHKPAASLLRDLLRPSSTPRLSHLPPEDAEADTVVYPISQMTQLFGADSNSDLSTELPALTGMLTRLATDPACAGARWTFTAGYFNPAASLTALLLQTTSNTSNLNHPDSAPNIVLTASPYANGFYKSPGISGMLPSAYTLLARRFLRAVDATAASTTSRSSSSSNKIVMKEWRRGTVGEPGAWTYHAKGLWITLPQPQQYHQMQRVPQQPQLSPPSSSPPPPPPPPPPPGPCITIIGSSNYTKRSYSLDLETGVVVATRDPDLMRRLGEEERWLQEHAKPVTLDDLARNDRRVGLGVRIAMKIVELVGGAL